MAGVGAESSGDGVFGDYGVYELSIVTESGRGLCDNLHGYTRLFCFVSFRFEEGGSIFCSNFNDEVPINP